MKSYIKAIIIFNKNGEKRVVPLEQGVNIITGESKTGKSALVEIIDYCLCSTRCTIPKGKITDFSYLYTLVMAIDDNTYVIARYNWDDGSKMHFSKEAKGFEPENLELSYFVEKPALPYKDVKNEIECALGLFVTNMATDADQQGKKASLRNMVSYLFQHQNLMASKFALFYRFSDFYKRKDVIDQFPVFAGMISQEYYSDLIQLNTLKAQLKQKYKKQKANEKSTAYIKENLSPLLTDYFALLEQDFDGKISVQKMLKIASDLPEFDDTQLFGENKIAERYSELNAVLENLRNEEREILLKIKNIDNAFDTGSCRVDLLTQYSLLLTMVSLLEEAVNTLCRLYHNINHLDKEVKDIKGSGLERAAKYLKDVVGIDGFTADKQWEYITVIRDARNMVVHNGGRIYKEFDKYDKFKIGYREEDHQLYLEYNDIVKMYDAILDFMDRTFRIIPQG